MKQAFDLVGAMMAWEEGTMGAADEVNLFQHLADTGLAWQLQGMYGRRAAALLREGLIHKRGQTAD